MIYQDLITKFFTNEISDEEMIRLKSWLELNPENRHIFDEQNELWQTTSILSDHNHYKFDLAWKNVSSHLGFDNNGRKSVIILTRNKLRILLVAATIALIIGISGLSHWIIEPQSVKYQKTATTKITTKVGEKANIFLSDSTKITLNSVSSLQYNGDFNVSDRVVILSGEAFFDIHTNPEKPFLVELEDIRISATGTRFNVYSFFNEDRIETTLVEGVIQVYIKNLEPFLVKPGQQFVYFKRFEKVQVRDVFTDTYTSWKEDKLQFRDTPFEEVLRQLGRRYKVNFEVTDHDLLDLKFNATFIDESIEDIMQMLQTVSPITYTIKEPAINDKQYIKTRIIVRKRKI